VGKLYARSNRYDMVWEFLVKENMESFYLNKISDLRMG